MSGWPAIAERTSPLQLMRPSRLVLLGSCAVSLPRITLMQAEEVGRPFHRDGWIYEEKYDGWRIVAYNCVRVSLPKIALPDAKVLEVKNLRLGRTIKGFRRKRRPDAAHEGGVHEAAHCVIHGV